MSELILDKIRKTKEAIDAQDALGPFFNKPLPEPSKPDQEEMDKLASALTEAVLQLRAGDMDGARKTLMGADYQCGIRIHTQIPPTDHYLDALRYGTGVTKYEYQPDSPHGNTATEVLYRQQIAERQMRAIRKDMVNNLNNTVLPIIKDPGA